MAYRVHRMAEMITDMEGSSLIVTEQSRTAETGWSSSSEVGRGSY
jgi:hypothetical protein